MKAALCRSLDGPDGIEIADIDPPEPGPRDVVIGVEAVGLNFMDTLITRGAYQDKPSLPFAPGGEVAGRIVRIGAAVSGFAVGDRVAAYVGHGGACEEIAVPAERLVRVPDAVLSVVAAGLNVTYGTAMHGLKDRAQASAGETVAVLGARGGAGLAAIDCAVRLGLRVIACGSSLKSLEVCGEHGAHATVAAPPDELKDALREAAGGAGPDIVYDCIGGDFAEPALRSLAFGGRFLVVGFAAGSIPKLPLNIVMLKSLNICGIAWGPFARSAPTLHAQHMAEVIGWVATGDLEPHVHDVRPLDQAAEAIRDLIDRKVAGKLILTPRAPT